MSTVADVRPATTLLDGERAFAIDELFFSTNMRGFTTSLCTVFELSEETSTSVSGEETTNAAYLIQQFDLDQGRMAATRLQATHN
jgi:hypothetical protein